jgi:hypothetical protein
MPYIKYQDIRIQKKGLDLIERINDIIKTYQDQGYSLTLRQVYYQLVSRDVIENNENSYKNIGNLVSNGRLAGLIDWNAIEDRNRSIRSLTHWKSPGEIIEAAAMGYRIDLWESQPFYVEVWVEKDALIGIVKQVADGYDVPCFSCRGYNSQSEMWNTVQRMEKATAAGKTCIILYLGDHDPSGQDMTRDIRNRLGDIYKADVKVNRIALTMPQIQQYNPPPNPAKITDTRAAGYIKQYGPQAWELDAIEPAELDRLIREHIELYLDQKLYEEAQARQEREQAEIYKLLEYSYE